jgi:hypothetical protein
MHLTETEWWQHMMEGIYGARLGDAKVIIDAEGASSGVGKSGLAVYLAKLFSNLVGYDFVEDDMTLSGAEYLQRWREHPGAEQPSVLVLDELGGAGAGNSRRAMSNQNVALGNSWQLMRQRRVISIVTTTHWSRVDVTLRRQADYRLWCLRKPIGYFVPYKVTADFDKGKVRTKSFDDVNRIRFPDMAGHDDPHYNYLASLKDELLNSNTLDADELQEQEQQREPEQIERQTKIRIAQQMRDKGMSGSEVSDAIDMSESWVHKYTDPATAE